MPVILMPPTLEHEREFLLAVRRSRDLHDPWATPPNRPEAFRRWQARTRDPSEEPRIACFVPDGPGDDARRGRMIGVVNLSRIALGGLMGAYAGWYGFEGGTGRGWMAEAVGGMLDLAFGTLGLHRIEANIQPGNHPSRRLAARVGFRLEGFSPSYLRIGGAWRDHERWAIREDAWTVGVGPRGETGAGPGPGPTTATEGDA